MSFSLMPIFESWSNRACHDGSTFSEENPFSGEKPMCATCLNSDGAEIIDLSIFAVPAFSFFLLELALLAAARFERRKLGGSDGAKTRRFDSDIHPPYLYRLPILRLSSFASPSSAKERPTTQS